MIQFLRFNEKNENDVELKIIKGSEAVKFFTKRVFILLIFIYSTLFLPVAVPFFKTPVIPMYFVGAMATMFYLLRFINYLIKFKKYSGGGIRIYSEGVDVTDAEKSFKIPAQQVTYLEKNILGNCLIREKYNITSFPLILLKEDDREIFVNQFQDMAPKRTNAFKKIWEIVDAIAVALVIAVHIIQYVVQAYYIPTGSMEDTLRVGDHLFVEKITFGPIVPQMIFMETPIHLRWLGVREIQRGDIVIFRPHHEKEKDYIKRVIALPGDRFEMKQGAVYINGQRIEESYTKGRTNVLFPTGNKVDIEGVVPEGKLIVLGDNRENSSDSRYFGYLDTWRVKGRAFILYWNTSQIFKWDFSRIGLIR